MTPAFDQRETVERHPSVIPGAMQDEITRDVPGLGRLHYAFAPAGWVAENGNPRKRDYRVYKFTPDGEEKAQRLISVTTLIGKIVPKGGLVPWAEARGIEGAVLATHRGLLDPNEIDDVRDAVRIVRSAGLGSDRARDDAASRGVDVHALLETYATDGRLPDPEEHPEQLRGYVRALARWLDVVRPVPVMTEQIVCDPEAGYAGRFDLVADVTNGEDETPRRVLFDAKTSEHGRVYDAVHLQLGLLRRAMVACGDGPVDEGRVVVFAGDGSWREMRQVEDPVLVESALRFAQALAPVTAECEAYNRAARRTAA